MAPVPEPVRKILGPAAIRFRHATRTRRMLPSFLLIGAQRAGTTSLFYHLRCHPEIEGPRTPDASIDWPKETHFFDEHFAKGLDWYRGFFPLELWERRAQRRGRALIPGEATPYYMFHPLVPERVAATLPDIRLLALLRDPVERAYSHYQLMHRTGRERLSFEQAIEAEPERLEGMEEIIREGSERLPGGGRKHHHHRHRAYVGRSLYAEQLERWLEHFPREQLLVIRVEDFWATPKETFSEVLAFLGARPWFPEEFEQRNIGAYAPIDDDLRARLEETFAEPNARLVELFGDGLAWPTRTGAPRS